MKRTSSPRHTPSLFTRALRTRLRVPVTLVMLVSTLTFPLQSNGITLVKTNSNSLGASTLAQVNALGNASYIGGGVPSALDTILFDNNITAASTFRISSVANSTLAIDGLRVLNPSGAITLQNTDNQSQTLALGAGGIDLSAATQNLTITNATGGSTTLNLTAPQNWLIGTGRTLTVNSVITGTGTGLNILPGVAGLGGVVTLAGANTFTGATNVTNSQLNLDYGSAANRIDSASALSLTRATLNLQGSTTHAQTVAGLNLGTGYNQLTRSAGTATLTVGAITRTSADALLNVGTAGVVTTSTGNVNGILGGWAVLNKTDWAVGGGAINALATYTDRTGAWADQADTSNIRVTGSITAMTSDTINSLKFNSGAFNITQNAGTTLNILSGGILKNDNNATTISGGSITAGGAANGSADTLYIWNNQNTMAVSSNIVNNGADTVNLVKAGDSVLRFDNTAAHTMTGTVTIAAGRIIVGNANTAGTLPGSAVVFAISPGAAIGGTANDAMLTYNRTDAQTWTQNMSGVGGDDGSGVPTRFALSKIAAGALTLTPTVANTYFGGTFVSSGALIAGNTNAFSPNSKFNLANTAGVVLNLNNFSNTIRGLTTGGTTGGGVTLGSATLTISPVATDILTYAGVISGTGGLTKTGAGQQTLSAAQTFTGPLTVNNGTLIFSSTLTPNAINVNGGTLTVPTVSVPTVTMTGGAFNATTLTAPSLTMSGGTLTATTATVSGSLTVGGGIFQSNAAIGGTITANANGRILLNPGSTVPANASITLNGAGATVMLDNGSNDSIGTFSGTAGSALLVQAGSAGSSLTFNDTGSKTVGAIGLYGVGNGQLNIVKSGGATWTLAGGSAYNGSTTINSGALIADAAALTEVLPDTTTLTLAAGTSLTLNNHDETIGALLGAGNVNMGSGVLTVGGNGATGVYSGSLSGQGGTLVKTGSGVMTLTGGSSFAGFVQVSETVRINSSVLVTGGVLELAKVGGGTLASGVPLRLDGLGSTLEVSTSQVLGALTASRNTTLDIASGATLSTSTSYTAGTSSNAPGNDIYRVAKGVIATRVMNIPTGTSGLTVGMTVTGVGVPAGTVITQVLSHDQILVSDILTLASPPGTEYAFGPVSIIGSAITGSGVWEKNGTGSVVLTGGGNFSGTMRINEGTVRAGGVTHGGRLSIQDAISDNASVEFAASGVQTLTFARNSLLLMPLERVGSIAGGSATSTINLTNAASSTALAIGGNNSSTTYSGTIRGNATSILFKEGTGTFTWVNNDVSGMDGTVHVEQGGMVIGGTAGLSVNNTLYTSNQAGAFLTLSTTALSEVVAGLGGGGRGATRLFSNGTTTGALGGSYIGQTGGGISIGASGLVVRNTVANTLQIYGGNISGTGNLIKEGNSTLELRGNANFTGDTIVRTLDGTADADNITSVLRIGAYSASAGVGESTAGGFGMLGTRDLRLIAANTVNTINNTKNVQFDLNGSTQTVNALTSAGGGAGIKRFNLQGGTINIVNTSGQAGQFDGLMIGNGTINVSATAANSGWTYSANGNVTHTGQFNIGTFGRVILDRELGTMGDTVHVTVGGGGASTGVLQISRADRMGSLAGTGVVNMNQGLTLLSGPRVSNSVSSWTGVINGGEGVAFTLDNRGSIRMRSNQNYTGSTVLSGASALFLDYSAGATDILKGGGASSSEHDLVLSGGSIYLNGNFQGDSVGKTLITQGGSLIAAARGDSSRFGLGAISRERGGVLQIKGATATTTNAAGLLGTLGGFAVYSNGAYVDTWAVPNGGSNAISGLSSGAYTPASSFDELFTPDPGWGTGKNTDVTGTNFLVEGDTGSLRFNTAQASGGEIILNLGGTSQSDTHIIESGGILVTKNVRHSDVVMTDNSNGAGLAGGVSASAYGVLEELVLHQHNPFGSLVLDVPIINAGVFTGLTKAGKGRVILAQNNAYSGQTVIVDGVLQLGRDSTQGSLGSNAEPVINHGYLQLSRSDNSLEILNDITGTGAVIVDGFGSMILRGANSDYYGTTQVRRGTLRVSSSINALGTTDGLTVVSNGANIELNNVLGIAETFYMKGGSLLASIGGSTINGHIILAETSKVGVKPGQGGSNLTINGSMVAAPGAVWNVDGTTDDAGVTTVTLLTSGNNVLNSITLPTDSKLQIGNNSAGSIGRSSVAFSTEAGNQSLLIFNNNDGHSPLSGTVSGSGGLRLIRNNLWVTGNNTYTGGTVIGGNLGATQSAQNPVVVGVIGLANVQGDMRVGNDTYTGSLGSGPIVVQSSNGGNSNIRYALAANATVANAITLNPWTDGTNPRNAGLFRYGMGTVNFTGTITAGAHDIGPGTVPGGTLAQRATIESQTGGRLILSGQLNNGPNNRLNFLVNTSGWLEFAGSANNTLWGNIVGTGNNNTNSMFTFNNTGLTTLKGTNNFVLNNTGATGTNNFAHIMRGTVRVDHTDNATTGGIWDDADLYLLRGATLQFNNTEVIGQLLTQRGSTLDLMNAGARLTVDDSATHVYGGLITGGGEIVFGATGGTGSGWHGVFNSNNNFTSNPIVGGSNLASALRVNYVANAGLPSAIGTGDAIIMGLRGNAQQSSFEFTGRDPSGNTTNRDFLLSGTGAVATLTSAGAVSNGNIVSFDALQNVSGLTVGMFVIGAGIPAGVQVADIDTVNNRITLSSPVTIGAATVLDFETSAASTVRIGGNGIVPLILNGDVKNVNLGNKTVVLHGQSTAGNTLNGKLDQGSAVMTLQVNPNVGNADMFGAGRWILTNTGNNFSGNISVAMGVLELSGNLGAGNTTTSIMGNLTATRTIDLGTNNFDGRRFDINGGGDGLGAAGGITGTILFNDLTAGTLTLGSNITFTQSFNSTTNPGNGEIINNGQKVVVIQGNLTSGASGDRNWILDGSNTGTNTISGTINNGTSNAVGVVKEGAGLWRLTGTNNFSRSLTVARGILEIGGGTTLNDALIVNLSNAGSDGSSAQAATIRFLTGESIGGLTGAVGTIAEIQSGNLTVTNANQTFNGVLTGAGGFIRTSSDATARVQTFTNLNTYQGGTQILATGGATGNRIDVTFLANGGQPSGIGQSSNDAANLVINTGTTASTAGSGGLRWVGLTNQSTDRLMTIGAGAGAANIWADGTVTGFNVPTISFTNPGAIAFTGTGNRTLTLRGGNKGNNTFAPLIGNNGAEVTSLTKIEQGTWVVTNANTFTGAVTVNGGTLAITNNNALGTSAGGTTVTLPGNDSVSYLDLRGVTVTGEALTLQGGANGNFFGLAGTTGTSEWTGTVAVNNSAIAYMADGASVKLSGAVSGGGAITKVGNGTLILSGTNTATGAFNARGGRVVLDYNSSTTSRLADGAALVLGAGTGVGFIRVSGSNDRGIEPLISGRGTTIELNGGAGVIETVGSVTLEAGASYVTRPTGTSILRMNAITRAAGAGATIDFSAAGIAQADTNNSSNGILGGYATIAKTDWATTVASGAADTSITALAPASYAATWTSTSNTNVPGGASSFSGATNSVRFNTAAATTVTLSAAGTVTTGGILVTPNVGANNLTITGSTLTAGTAAPAGDLIVHQHNTAGTLTIGSQITGAIGLTKSGLGDLILTGENNHTGLNSINEGNVFVGNGGATGQLGSGAGQLIVNGNLIFNSTHAAAFNQAGALRGNGTITLAATNTRTIVFTGAADNVNFTGNFVVSGGTLAGIPPANNANQNALGSNRVSVTVNSGGTLDMRNLNQGLSVTLNGSGRLLSSTGTSSTVSGAVRVNSSNAIIEASAGALLNVSGQIFTTTGFTKTGNGTVQLSANQMQTLLPGGAAGATTANADPSLLGQINVTGGELRLGNARALGGTGVGNETVSTGLGVVDLNGQNLSYGDDPDAMREIFRIAGTGFNGQGTLRNGSGTGTFAHLFMVGNSTINGGGYINNARLDLGGFDTNTSTGSTFEGNVTRVRPTIEGNGAILTIIGSNAAVANGVTLREPNFLSALGGILVREGNLRLEQDVPLKGTAAWTGLTSAEVTGGIDIGYGGASAGDVRGSATALGPNVGARLTLFRSHDVHHTVNITMNGALAATNGGANYIDVSSDTLTFGPRTYLDGTVTLSGGTYRNNFINNDYTVSSITIVDQGNLTGTSQAKLIVNGPIVGTGGFTKTGTREVRLTANNTFTGATAVLRFGSTATPWQSNTVNVNGVDFQTFGDAEGWAEYSLTLAGQNGTLAGTSEVILQRRGMLTLDNTTRLDATSGVLGGNNNNRINDAATFSMTNGWLRINGGTTANNEAIATTGGARLRLLGGMNLIELWPTDGLNQAMTLTIGQIERSAGSVLRISNLDATSTFGSATPAPGVDSVRVQLNTAAGLDQVGTGATTKVVHGLLGGIIPHGYLEDIRELAYNNGAVSDLLNQGRLQQQLAGSHFMTYEGGFLRPLDDSEYYVPADGVVSVAGAAGKNLAVREVSSIMKEDVTVNSLRIGQLADNRGEGGSVNNGTTLTTYNAQHAITLNLDGKMTIASGMISSANFTVGNTTNIATVIQGGAIDFGNREGIINNQNAFINLTTGAVGTGNLELRTNLMGTAGITKSGLSQVVLDGRNTYSGVTSITEGSLFIRNGRTGLGATGLGNGVFITGSGNLLAGNGIQIGYPSLDGSGNEDIYVGVLQGSQTVLQANNDLLNYFGNLTIDNVDASGQTLFSPLMQAAANATLIFNGNIYGANTPISSDVTAIDPRIISTSGSGNGNIIIRGQIGDKRNASTGAAEPVANFVGSLPTGSTIGANTITNENDVLRFQIASGGTSNELNVTLDRQYNAAGRFQLDQGVLIINYDPLAVGNDGDGFYTQTALSRIVNQDSNASFGVNGNSAMQGFTINGTGDTALLLSKPGQIFNMGSWSVASGNNTWIGGMNETGSVQIGSNSVAGTLTLNKTTRFHANAGGTVLFNMRVASSGILKTGRGLAVLQNNFSTGAAGTTPNFELGGGIFRIDHAGQATTVARLGSDGNFTFRGGSLEVMGNTAAVATSASYASNTGAARTIAFTAGASEIVVESRSASATTLTLGNGNTTTNPVALTRSLGATANLVELQSAAGAANMVIISNNTTAMLRNRIVPWATYGNQKRTAVDFAYLDNGGNVSAYTAIRGANEYINDVSQWAASGIAGLDVSETQGTGFFGVLGASFALGTIRFDAAADSVISIANDQTLSVAGDTVAGGILVSSNTSVANKTITGGSLTVAGAPDLVIHQYGKGVLDIASTITGTMGLTITGPSVTGVDPATNQPTYGTTGTVRLSGNNNYSGDTYINGAVVEISDASALGSNPASPDNGRLTMNGGGLRWTGDVATLGNRGITFQGNGGLIDIVKADANLIIGSSTQATSAAIASESQFRGDLVKVGAGMLTLQGSGTGHNSGFSGLLDIKQGSLGIMVDVGDANVGTSSMFGTNRSWLDATIMRNGTSLLFNLGNGNNGGEWGFEEFFRFEGNNTVTYSTLLDINTPLGATGALDGQINLGNRRILNLNGVIDIQGTTTFEVGIVGPANANNVPGTTTPLPVNGTGSVLRLNNSAGYVMGSGDIVKDGQGLLEFRANIPDWKGGLIIKQGNVYASNQADVLGTGWQEQGANKKKITLGSVDRQGTASLFITNPDGPQNWLQEIYHDIDVMYNPLQMKRIGINNISNGSYVAYKGTITLNDNLNVLLQDGGVSNGGEQAVLNFDGSFRDGTATSGNIVFQATEIDVINGTTMNAGANDALNGRLTGYAVLNNDNSLWTGDVVISGNMAYDHDKTTVLRMGHNLALTAANDITMNFNSILQAGGKSVTVGSLFTQGGNGAFNGDVGTVNSSTNGGTEIIENAATTAGTFTITQTTPVTYEGAWDAFFRNGTLNSQFLAPGTNAHQPSAALNIVKAGNGWATLTLDNDYSGTTTVNAGVLQVGRGNIGDTGRVNALGTTVNNGGTLAGTGWVQGGLSVLNGGLLAPGDQAGEAIGTLNVNGAAIFASGATALMQMRMPTYNNPGVLDASATAGVLDPDYIAWRDGLATDAFSSALQDVVSNTQHDMVNVTGTLNWVPGTRIRLINEGYTPKAGDVFHLFKAGGFAGSPVIGATIRDGTNNTGSDVELFPLGGNFFWDLSKLATMGVALVVTQETASAFVLPSFKNSTPTRNPATGVLDPGTPVSLSIFMNASAQPATYQWYATNAAGKFAVGDPVLIEGLIPDNFEITANFEVTSVFKGAFTVTVTNEGGTIESLPVNIEVRDLPQVMAQPAPLTVNPGQAATFTAKVTSPLQFDYQWRKNGEDIPGATGTLAAGNMVDVVFTIPEAQNSDEGLYSVRVFTVGGGATSNAVALSVNDPITNVVVNSNPVGPNFYLGDNVVLSYTAVGTTTGRTQQWFRRPIGGGAETAIAGATAATYTITNIKNGAAPTGSEAEYFVKVNNVVGAQATSSNHVSVVPLPSAPQLVSNTLAHKTMLAGELLEMNVAVTGKPVLRYVWRRNGTVITGATAANYVVPAVAVANGGTYTFEVSNSAGRVPPANAPITAEVVVVDSSTRIVSAATNASVTLNANVGVGPKTAGVVYKWFKDGNEISTAANGTRFTGFNTRALKITKTEVTDDGIYTCKVTGLDGVEVEGCTHDVRIFTDKPEVDNPQNMPDAIIGGTYFYQITVNPDRTKTPATFAASGLPPGLKVDGTTGVISGKPTATKNGGYAVKISASNGKGKSNEVPVTLNVRPLPTGVAGSFVGPVARNSVLNGNLGGRIEMTVTGTATFTGRLIMGAETLTFPTGLALDIPLDSGTNPSVSFQIARKNNTPLTVALTINTQTGYLTNATVTDGAAVAGINGWRSVWNSTTAQATDYLGLYNVGLVLADNDPLVGNPTVPQGAGYVSFTVARDGKMTLAGKTADGENITGAVVLGPQGEIMVYQTLFTPTRGSLLGTMMVGKGANATAPADNPVTGAVTCVRPANTTATARVYRAGYGLTTPVSFQAVGGFYAPPATGLSILNLANPNNTITNNARLDFSQGGVDIDVVSGVNVAFEPNIFVTVGSNSKITVPVKRLPPLVPVAINPAGTSLTVAAAKGTFSGKFSLSDMNPRTTPPVAPPTVTRAVTFQGLVVPVNGQLVGMGYFILSQLPSDTKATPILIPAPTTPTTSPNLSGLVIFEKVP